MTLGERIKRVRTFRSLTQRELGLKLGYEERNADVRVAPVSYTHLDVYKRQV